MGRYEKAETGRFVRQWIISALLGSSNTTIKLVMVYNNKIKCSLILLRSSRERNTC